MSVLHLTTANWIGAGPDPLLSKRSVINLSYPSEWTYHAINHFLMGDASVGFVGNDYFVSSKTWMQVIDVNGWPNDATVSGNTFGGTVRIPSTADYTGKYVLTWTGNGRVAIQTGTWTVDAGLSSNYTQNSNGNYTNTAGLVPYIVVTATGLSAQPNLVAIHFTQTGASGSFLKGFKFYRLGDQARLDAGKVFRTPYLDALATLNPAAIRFLNWHGGNNSRNCRFEHRTLPAAAGYAGTVNWVASPPYTTATFSAANQYTLAAVSTGSNQTPVAMQNGEVATARIGTTAVRQGTYTGSNVFKTITGISTGATTTFTVNTHGFAIGDTIIHMLPTGTTQLDQRPVVITAVTTNTYTVAVNSTGYGAFTAGTAGQYVSLNVGARGAYPIAFETAQSYASSFGDGYIISGNYKTFYFDKSITMSKDSAGNPVFGVWLFNDLNGGGHRGDVPLEICTALINEVNERVLALGYSNPVHMFISMPHRALLSMDADHTAGSNYATNAVDVILNGANGYAGLTAAASVIIEYSNEIWNAGGSNFSQTYYLTKRGVDRWGTGLTSLGDYASMSSLRSTVMARDIRAAFPGNIRVRLTLGAQGFLGYTGHNMSRAEGTSAYLTDVLTGAFGQPISNHDCMNHGTYFDPAIDSDITYYSGSGTGSFNDDSALYNGTTPYAGAANPSQAITNFVAKTVNTGTPWQTTKSFCDPANPTAGKDGSFAVALAVFGKKSIHYEGGMDWASMVGANEWTGVPLTANQAAFKRAVQNSTQWATAYVTDYMGAINSLANSYIPASYLITNEGSGSGGTINQRWAHASPDTYASGTEGQALLNNPTWVAMGVRNRALSV